MAAVAAAPVSTVDAPPRPGRTCPLDFVYPPTALKTADDGEAEVLYAVGNLYGNTEALAALERLLATERGPVRVVFGGDFHWFDIAPDTFAEVAQGVTRYEALCGNVERELAREEQGEGCGCAYPQDVDDATVERSNAIIARLRETARAAPLHLAWLERLPMLRAVRVGGRRVLLLHGDTRALAGWTFSIDAMADTTNAELASSFRDAGAEIIACGHTCLPFARRLKLEDGPGVLINNGAAGMPNFRDQRFGVVTRIAIGERPPTRPSLYGCKVGDVRADAMPLHYDHWAWWRLFRRQWPVGSAADLSYADRIRVGPSYTVAQACRWLGEPAS